MPERYKDDEKTAVAVVINELDHIKSELREIKDEMVMRSEFEPIQKIVYAVVMLIMTAVVGAVIALVVTGPA